MITFMKSKTESELSEFDAFWAPIIAGWPKEVQEYHQKWEVAIALRDERQRLGEAVKTRRLELGISQRKLAKVVGISQREVCHIEQAKSNPTLSTQVKILSALGLKMEISAV
jgi:DNA-binding XRE family transcriptional regulator